MQVGGACGAQVPLAQQPNREVEGMHSLPASGLGHCHTQRQTRVLTLHAMLSYTRTCLDGSAISFCFSAHVDHRQTAFIITQQDSTGGLT